MKVLITGGCGFIGANLVEYLLEKGHIVRVFDNLSIGSEENLENACKKFDVPELIVGDVRDKRKVEETVKSVDAVVHLAAHTNVVNSLENPEEDFQINAIGTFNVLEACRKNEVRKFVYASSNAVVGEQKPPINERKIPAPISPYGASKLTGESFCSAYFHSFEISTVSLRFSNAYGPYSSHKTSVVAKFMRRVKEGKPLIIYGDGSQTRDFIYVRDVCEAVYLSLNSDIGGEVLQIATGEETTINQLAEKIKKIVEDETDKTVEIKYELPRKGEISRSYSSIEKAKETIGYNPKINLKEGLETTWKWFKEKSSL